MVEFIRWPIFIKIVSQVVKRLRKIMIIEKDCDSIRKGYFFNYYLPFPPALQTLRR